METSGSESNLSDSGVRGPRADDASPGSRSEPSAPFSDSAPTQSSSHESLLAPSNPPQPAPSEDDLSRTKSFSFKSLQPGQGATEAFTPEDANDKTLISQRAVAAPEEFYRSMPLAELAAMLEGKRLDHFTVEQMIGGGGMGAVFRGRDERLDRTVAIKVIPASKRDPETLRRFRLEAQAAARLDHPNIARVYYVGEAEQWNYIVFEFIDGVNVRDLVSMEGPLAIDDAVFYTRQVAEALQHAFIRDVVHRDIKPSNILVTSAGIAKVVDMGLARNRGMEQSSADATASGVTLGTFDYISPEQARNPRDADVRSDLYSLGCSLFFMLTGSPPFPEGTVLQKLLKHGSVPPPDPRSWREDISDQLYSIIMKLMAKQPSLRYQNPAELINDLMLLAEIEDLPRSQSPGTLMVTPSADQKSLLETNLPWLVAVAFLLGSTIWLQSMQALSPGFTLRPLEFSEVQPQPLEPRPVVNEVGAIPSTSGERTLTSAEEPEEVRVGQGDVADSSTADDLRSGPWVVSQFRPADVPESRWVDSLASALRRVSDENPEIELRGYVELSRPIVIDTTATIRSSPFAKATLAVPSGLVSRLNNKQAAIQLQDAKLRLENLDIRFDASDGSSPERYQVGLFQLLGSCDLTLAGSQLTFEGLEDARGVFAVLADETRGVSLLSQGLTLSLAIEDSVVRGEASLLGLQVDLGQPNRVLVSLEDSLFALGGVALQVDNTSLDYGSQVARNLRLFCQGSTFFTAGEFAEIVYAGAAEPLLSLNRTSENCVYDTLPDQSHLVVRGLDQLATLETLNRFLLKGRDNAYDDKLDTLCRCYNPDGTQLLAYEFAEAAQEGWFEERGNDLQIRWAQPRDPDRRLSALTPADFQLDNERFSPGVQPEGPPPPL